ncbi:MAG: hypothetical protein ACRBF0_03985 [Calditrichia bacterium]
MNITNQIIIDLFPLYQAGEASEDTERLIADYFRLHPKFAEELSQLSKVEHIQDLPVTLTSEDEMSTLNKTKRLLKIRSVLFGAALFFSCLPLAFGDISASNEPGVHWLWTNFPEGAFATGFVGLICWAGYFYLKKQLSVTAL